MIARIDQIFFLLVRNISWNSSCLVGSNFDIFLRQLRSHNKLEPFWSSTHFRKLSHGLNLGTKVTFRHFVRCVGLLVVDLAKKTSLIAFPLSLMRASLIHVSLQAAFTRVPTYDLYRGVTFMKWTQRLSFEIWFWVPKPQPWKRARHQPKPRSRAVVEDPCSCS